MPLPAGDFLSDARHFAETGDAVVDVGVGAEQLGHAAAEEGATMNISAVVGLPFCMGMRWFHDWSLPSAAARARGCPQ